jgi:hypothetical protein
MTWTAETNAQLVELWNVQGLTASQIALALGKTRNSVIGRANRAGLSRRKDGSHGTGHKQKLSRGSRETAGRFEFSAPKMPKLPVHPLPAPVNETPTVSLIDRKASQCAWICSEGAFDELTVCGSPVHVHSFCAGHAGRAYCK